MWKISCWRRKVTICNWKSRDVDANFVNRVLLHPVVYNELLMWNIQWTRISVNIMVFILCIFVTYTCCGQMPAAARSKHGSAAARLLGLRVRIPPGAWMSFSCECCVLSGTGLCVGLITCPEESCRVWCVLNVIVKPRHWGDPGPLGTVMPWKNMSDEKYTNH